MKISILLQLQMEHFYNSFVPEDFPRVCQNKIQEDGVGDFGPSQSQALVRLAKKGLSLGIGIRTIKRRAMNR